MSSSVTALWPPNMTANHPDEGPEASSSNDSSSEKQTDHNGIAPFGSEESGTGNPDRNGVVRSTIDTPCANDVDSNSEKDVDGEKPKANDDFTAEFLPDDVDYELVDPDENQIGWSDEVATAIRFHFEGKPVSVRRGMGDIVENDPAPPNDDRLEFLWMATPGQIQEDPHSRREEMISTQKMVTRHAVTKTCERIEYDEDIIYVKDREEGMDELFLYDQNTGKYEDDAGQDLKEIIEDLVGFAVNDREKEEIVSKLKDRNRVPFSALDGGEHEHTLRCVENGVLDIETWELQEHSPEYYMVTKLNARWDPDVDVSDARDFLESITPERYVDTLIEMLGDILTDHYDSKKFLIGYGPSNGGKSLLLKYIGETIGKENRTAESLRNLATGDWGTANLVGGLGVLANLADEIEGKRLEHTELVKKLVGGYETESQKKFGDPFYAENHSKLWNMTNNPPVIEDEEEAMAERLIPIEFPYRFVDEPDGEFEKPKDTSLFDEKLNTPDGRAALLQLMAEGLERLREQNWNVSLDETPTERLARYNNEADTVHSCAMDCFVETDAVNQYDGKPVFVTNQEAYTIYQEYAAARCEPSLDKSVFIRKLNQSGALTYGTPYKTLPSGDRQNALTGIAPSEEGWKYASSELKKRFADEVGDDEDVPTPNDGNNAPSGPQANPEGFFDDLAADVAADGAGGAFATVVSVITQLNEESSSEANDMGISTRSHEETDGDMGARDVIDALDTLEESNVIEQDDDGVYHVIKQTGSDDDGPDEMTVEPTDEEKRTVAEALRKYTDEPVSVSIIAGKASLLNGDTILVLKALCGDGVAERVDDDNYRYIGGDE